MNITRLKAPTYIQHGLNQANVLLVQPAPEETHFLSVPPCTGDLPGRNDDLRCRRVAHIHLVCTADGDCWTETRVDPKIDRIFEGLPHRFCILTPAPLFTTFLRGLNAVGDAKSAPNLPVQMVDLLEQSLSAARQSCEIRMLSFLPLRPAQVSGPKFTSLMHLSVHPVIKRFMSRAIR